MTAVRAKILKRFTRAPRSLLTDRTRLLREMRRRGEKGSLKEKLDEDLIGPRKGGGGDEVEERKRLGRCSEDEEQVARQVLKELVDHLEPVIVLHALEHGSDLLSLLWGHRLL